MTAAKRLLVELIDNGRVAVMLPSSLNVSSSIQSATFTIEVENNKGFSVLWHAWRCRPLWR